MTEIRKGQIVSIPEGIGVVKLIHQEFAYGIVGAELSATIFVEMKDGSEILIGRREFEKIKIVRPVYNSKQEIIGYTIDGDSLVVIPEKFKMLTS